MRQKLVIAILGALILGAFASLSFFSSPVSATMRLRIEDLSNGGDVGAVITDNGPDDINPLVGALTFNGQVGSFLVNVTTGLSKPIVGGSDLGQIDLNSVNVLTSGAGTLRLTLEDTGYLAGPGTTSNLLGTVGGTLTAPAGSTIIIQSWANGSNLVPDLGPDQIGSLGPIGGNPPPGSVPAWPAAFVSGPGAFSSSSSGDFNNGTDDTFSLFAQVDVNFAGVGSVSFDENQRAVPEPASLLLLGAGAAGLGLLAGRKRQRRNS